MADPCFYCEGQQFDGHECEHCGRIHQWPASIKLGHHCHWPGCPKEVPPAMWGCKPHWFRLPKALRDRIWAAYVPGQEITKAPSDEYLTVAREARDWIVSREDGNG